MHRIDSTTAELALHSVASTRRVEAALQSTLPEHTLMQRAGAATARLALALAPHARRVWIAAGPGNNGGDGLEAAARLARDGRNVGVWLVVDPGALPADAALALERARAAGVAIDRPGGRLEATDLAIDALLGIGGARAPRGALADAIRQLNALACPVLAIDLPSGLDADTGRPFGADAVRADHTLALLTAKPGLFTADGRDHAGSVWLERLGADAFDLDDASAAVPADALLIGTGARMTRASARPHAAHKGSCGDIAVIGGADGMLGAALLAARAAHAAGAGRVYVALVGAPEATAGYDPLRPELMFRPAWCEAPADVLGATTVVCGCGGGDAVRRVLPRLLSLVARLVLDADALNAIAADTGLMGTLQARARRGLHTVLTPHPLEAARLLGSTTAQVQADRLRAARELAERSSSIVVLKGSGSVIAAAGRLPAIAATGNAALASAGTGDVLAGWLGGLWAQQAEAAAGFEVAVRAVVEHGAAAEPRAPGPLRADDLVEALHRRLRRGP
jgi:hydroxyethylthiazole kinase-like uncharacterized protein yjeF